MIISKKYKLVDIIGNGEFGQIFKAQNIRTGQYVAVKQEPMDNNGFKLLKNETKIYQYLNNAVGFPRVFWFGIFENNYYMVISLLGKSLRKKRELGRFSLEDVCAIGIQMISRLEYLHKRGLIHRDVKPDNFLFGMEDMEDISDSLIHLIDFGLCRKYVEEDGYTHIPYRVKESILGTPNFISINVHNLCEPSRRDDMESVVYILYYLWGMYTPPVCSEHRISEYKSQLMDVDNKITPLQFREYFAYCRSMEYDKEPNYQYLMSLLCVHSVM